MTTSLPIPAYDAGAAAKALLGDIWCEATAAYWMRRAEQFEAARPRRGDYTGNATAQEIYERYDSLTAAAQACRARAAFLDASIAEYDDTLTALAAGAAA